MANLWYVGPATAKIRHPHHRLVQASQMSKGRKYLRRKWQHTLACFDLAACSAVRQYRAVVYFLTRCDGVSVSATVVSEPMHLPDTHGIMVTLSGHLPISGHQCFREYRKKSQDQPTNLRVQTPIYFNISVQPQQKTFNPTLSCVPAQQDHLELRISNQNDPEKPQCQHRYQKDMQGPNLSNTWT